MEKQIIPYEDKRGTDGDSRTFPMRTKEVPMETVEHSL